MVTTIFDIDIEKHVIGGLLSFDEEKSIEIKNAYEILEIHHFHDAKTALAFGGILALRKAEKKPNILSLTKYFREQKVSSSYAPDPYWITTCTKNVVSPSLVVTHCIELVSLYERRVLEKMAMDLLISAQTDSEIDIPRAINKFSTELKIHEKHVVKVDKMTPEYRTRKTYDFIEQGRGKNGITGIPSGFYKLDNFTGGFQNGDLIVMAGRPGTFKTALTLAFCHNAARAGFPALMFQQEMAEHQTGVREIAMYSQRSSEDIRKAEINQDVLNKAIEEIRSIPVYIDHTSGITIGYIRSTARALKDSKGIQIIVIDYLQLSNTEKGKDQTSEEAIGRLTRNLKTLAKELEVPIILLSQLSRSDKTEIKQNKMPSKADLKGSGAIEADADMIILLYNPYNEQLNMLDRKGELDLLIEKNRMGQTGVIVTLNVNPATNTFYNLGEMQQWPESSDTNYQALHSKITGESRDFYNDQVPF
jgi:replicative DNA helicase